MSETPGPELKSTVRTEVSTPPSAPARRDMNVRTRLEGFLRSLTHSEKRKATELDGITPPAVESGIKDAKELHSKNTLDVQAMSPSGSKFSGIVGVSEEDEYDAPND